MLSLRKLSVIGFLVCAAALLSAVYIEEHYLIAPCPMCMLQRIVFVSLACVFVIGFICNFKTWLRYVYLFIILFLSSIGLAIATKQFWLQYFAPPQKISCSAGLERLIEAYPILDALKIALSGSAECATVDFTIFTISIAGWSVIMFGTFIILTIYIGYRWAKYSS